MERKIKLDLIKTFAVKQRSPLKLRGEQLSNDNLCHVRSVYFLWVSMWVDLPGSNLAGFGRLSKMLLTADVGELLATCELIVASLRERKCNYVQFKAELSHAGYLCISLLGLCKAGLQLWLEKSDETALKAVYSWFSFPLRMHFTEMPSLEREAQEKFIKIQERGDLRLTSLEAHILSSWFPIDRFGEIKGEFSPHFTSGSSQEGKDLARKYRALGATPRMRYTYNIAGLSDIDLGPEKKDTLNSRVLFVPKSYKAYRMVSLEPSVLNWISCGWADVWTNEIRRHNTPMARRYRINTDCLNAEMAQRGSIDGSFATIDLSSASDSVTEQHVHEWFKKTWLYKPLILGRTTHAQMSDGSLVKLKTFMGMGSRLCFLLETAVFCAIVTAAIASTGDDPRKSFFRVYGDDIVVEAKYAAVVMARLEQNGFSVNASKSYWRTDTDVIFRESCGGEYLNGHDITPVRIPRVNFDYLPSVHRVKPAHLQGLVDLANSLAGFRTARAVIIDELASVGPLPLFGQGGLESTDPCNFDKLQWYNYEWQYTEFEYSGLQVLPRRDHKGRKMRHDHYALHEWLRRSHGRERLLYPEDRIDVEMCTPRTCEWVRKYSEA